MAKVQAEQIRAALETGVKTDFEDETLHGLNGGERFGNIELPAPTIGTLMILDAIHSPFVTGSKTDIPVSDLMAAAFVICEPKKAARLAYRAKIAKEHHSYESACFNEGVADFANRVGPLPLSEGLRIVNQHLKLCYGGFEMIPKQEDFEDAKKNDLIGNGLPQSSQESAD